jgi:DNA-binding SARP family transcriptional activator
LVKLLALNGVTTADTAIDWLWPEVDAATGRARLRNVLNRLKERSGALVVRDADTLRLASDVVVDCIEFEKAASESATAAAEERVGRARHAVALYTGDLLPGDVYEDWASGHRERLRRRFVALADAVAADAETRGDTAEAARLLDLAVEMEPLDEVRTLRLCHMLQASGRAISASAVARRCIGLLAELGLDPGTDLARFAAVSA